MKSLSQPKHGPKITWTMSKPAPMGLGNYSAIYCQWSRSGLRIHLDDLADCPVLIFCSFSVTSLEVKLLPFAHLLLFCNILLQCKQCVFLAVGSALPLLFISSFCGRTALVSPQHFTAADVVFLIGAKHSCFEMERKCQNLKCRCYILFDFLIVFLFPFVSPRHPHTPTHLIFPCQQRLDCTHTHTY